MQLTQQQLDDILERLPDPGSWPDDFLHVAIGPSPQELKEMMTGGFQGKEFVPKKLPFAKVYRNGFAWEQVIEKPTARLTSMGGYTIIFAPSTLPNS